MQPDGIAGMNIGVLADQGNVSSLTIGKAADVLGPWSMKRGERLLNVDHHERRPPVVAGHRSTSNCGGMSGL